MCSAVLASPLVFPLTEVKASYLGTGASVHRSPRGQSFVGLMTLGDPSSSFPLLMLSVGQLTNRK